MTTTTKRERRKSSAGISLSWKWIGIPLAVGVLALIWTHVLVPLSVPSIASKLRAFEVWLERRGGRIQYVQLAEFPGMGVGVQTTHDVREKDEVLYVPLDSVICRDTVLKALPREISKTLSRSIPDDDLLAAFLVLERSKGTESAWAPYLNILPESIPSPMSFTDDEILELQIDDLMEEVYTARRDAIAAFELLFKKLSHAMKKLKLAKMTLPDYIWAKSVLNSRALTIRGARYLVPFADMFNGQSHPDTRTANNGAHFLDFHVISQDGVRILADRACAAHSQLMEDYGDNDNYVYMLNHGFNMASNPFDCVRVPLLSMDVPKQQLLRRYGLSPQAHLCLQPNAETPNTMALIQFQVETMTPTEVTACRGDCLDWNAARTPAFFSKQPYTALLLDRATDRLQAFPTTVEEDMGLLLSHDASLSTNMRLIVEFRMTRKVLLGQLIDHLTRQRRTETMPRVEAIPSISIDGPSSTDSRLPTDDSIDAKLTRFHAWIAGLQFSPNKLQVRYIGPGMGFGTFATANIEKDEIYLGVPSAAVMDAASAMRCPTLAPVFDSLFRSTGARDKMHELLLHLIYERFVRQGDSFYAPYLDLLPTADTSASPLYYTYVVSAFMIPQVLIISTLCRDDQVEMLAPTDLHGAIETYRTHVDQSFAAIHRVVLSKFPQIFPAHAFTRETYRWARFILDTRSIWWGGERRLAPLLDMINCKEGPDDPSRVHSTALDATGEMAITRAAWVFPPDAQVFENYGQPNWIYLLYHGFVLPRNSHDCAHVVFDMEATMLALNSQLYESFVHRLTGVATSLKPDFCLTPASITKPALQVAAIYVDLLAMTDLSYEVDGTVGSAERNMASLLLVLRKRHAAMDVDGVIAGTFQLYMEQQQRLLGRVIETLEAKLQEPLM
ncbi:Aste57867_4348 [Aphanomyces stellatus]|uniref:Aste57867_4348 protein n=1 Tax=Aphanomyces stellatus TaxID=120398 RepID=A0A485KGI2_9STRA|nr:hypothetical protein As57867_004336 [Aphanomyces stellatus]VFT81462.1 Aste57867_4348 [Aphanomyces stellatus]